MTQRSVASFIEDIWKTIASIERFTTGIEFAEFSQNQEKIFAVEKAIEIIGEAVKHLPESLTNKYPEIPWKEIAGMRDKLVHKYWDIDIGVVWKTSQRRVPQLKVEIARIMEELSTDE